MAQTNILKLSEVRNQERMDSEYFQKIILKLVSKIEKLPNQRLGDLCLVKSGRTPKYSEEGKVKVIRSGDLNRDLFVDRDELLKTNEQKLFFVNNNDIFISSIGRGSIGKINIYDEKEKLATVSEVNVLRNPKINPYYLFIFLRTIFGQEQINREITGATGQLHLLKSNTKKMLIPIPSDKFQKEIEKEVLLAKKYYEESKELYEKAEEILLKEMGVEDYISKKQASFITNYSAILEMERVDADYFQPKYSKIIDKIKGYSGGFDSVNNLISLKDKNFIPKDNISYKYIELSDVVKCGRINNFTYDFGNNLPTRARRLVSKGDVIISSIKGSSSACALITDELDNSIVSSGFYAISSKVINAETLLVLFKSPLLQELLKRGGSGTILMSIGKKEFQKIKIPIIKKEIQQKISDLVRKSSNLIIESK